MCVRVLLPCAGPGPGRGNCDSRGRGPRPGQTLLTLPEGERVGDWVGEARGLLIWVLAWKGKGGGQNSARILYMNAIQYVNAVLYVSESM